MTERVQAWQCIGCGKLEAPQTCIGICEDRKVEFVYAFEHEKTVAQLKLASQKAATLAALAGQLVRTTPREGQWKGSYRFFQDQARAVLAALAGDVIGLEKLVPQVGPLTENRGAPPIA